MFISVLNFNSADEELEQAGLSNVERAKKPTSNYFVMVFRGVLNFGESIWVGARLIFGNRCFICESSGPVPADVIEVLIICVP